VPARFTTGGAGGIATVLYHFFKIPVYLTVSGVNLLLLIWGLRFLPTAFLWRNLWGIAALSLFLSLVPSSLVLSADPLICALFGGALEGVGVGLVMRRDGSTGGTDVAALILRRLFPAHGPAFWVILIDTAIISLAVLSFRAWELFFYSLLSLFVSGRVMDRVLVQGDSAKSLLIITPKSDEVLRAVTVDLERGATLFPTFGGWEKRAGESVLCVVKNAFVPKVLSEVKRIDPAAFVVISHVHRVHGEGFRRF
jgi:uncharacterized membrane-anchored protein YitT (DUF2179 family)